LIRLGIRGFNPKLKKAAGRLEDLRTPEDEPIPPNTMAELRRDMERRRLVSDQIRQIENVRLEHLKQAPSDGPHAMVRLLARVIGVGIETADMLVQEVLSRNMRDRLARYAGLTGSPDESGTKRREKGLARSGNARVRRGMIQLAWRFLMFQKNSALAQWSGSPLTTIAVMHNNAPEPQRCGSIQSSAYGAISEATGIHRALATAAGGRSRRSSAMLVSSASTLLVTICAKCSRYWS
jgi:Transposase IS116/IS110/IS902 family